VDGLAAPKPLSQVVDMETDIFVSGRVSVSGITLIPRPSRARDLVTMAEVGSTRLTLLERVATGVGLVFRGAIGGNLTRSAGRCDFLYPTVRFPWPFVRNCYLLTVGKYRVILITIYATTNVVFTTIQCRIQHCRPVGEATEESQSRFQISSWPTFIGNQ